ALVSLFALPYTVILPVFVKEVLHGGEALWGVVMATSGVGAVAGALLLASRRSVLGLLRWIAWAPAVAGAGLIAFSFTRSLARALRERVRAIYEGQAPPAAGVTAGGGVG